jgi:hypothetical protein
MIYNFAQQAWARRDRMMIPKSRVVALT